MIKANNYFTLPNAIRLACTLAACFQVAGCATPLSRTVGLAKNDGRASIDIAYQKTEDTTDGRKNFSLVLNKVTDLRDKEGYQATLLGQGRNGMGLVYINYHTRKPVGNIVRELFEAAIIKNASTKSASGLEVDVDIDNFEYNEFPLSIPAFYSKLSVIIYSPTRERELSRKTYTFERDKTNNAKRYMRCWDLAKGDKAFHDAFEVIEKRISCQASSAASEFIDEILTGIPDQTRIELGAPYGQLLR